MKPFDMPDKRITAVSACPGAILAHATLGLDVRAQTGPAAVQDSGITQHADVDMRRVVIQKKFPIDMGRCEGFNQHA